MKHDNNIKSQRREFLKYLAGFTAGIMLPYPSYSRGITSDKIGEVLPKRLLGKTGQEVTMLGLGGYHIGWTTEKDAQETIEAAIEGGIRLSHDRRRKREPLLPDSCSGGGPAGERGRRRARARSRRRCRGTGGAGRGGVPPP